MSKGVLKNSLIVLLAGVTIFSVFRYASSVRERYVLLKSLNEARQQLAVLEKDKESLAQELNNKNESERRMRAQVSGLKEYLRASKKRLTKIFVERTEIQKKSEDLSSKFVLLKAENLALLKQRNKLNNQVAQASQENDTLKTKLGSISELRKIISALKKNKNNAYAYTNWKVKTDTIVEGNRGYLIKDGKFTYPTKVKIEVNSPLPVNNNERNIYPDNPE